jgi:hypothetical protein
MRNTALTLPHKEGPNEHRGATENYRHHHIPGGVKGTEAPPRLGQLMLLFLVFALLAMRKIVFGLVVHVVS